MLTQLYDWRGCGCTQHFQHISAPMSSRLKGSDSGGSNCSLGCDLPLAQLISRALPLWVSSFGSQLTRCCANTHHSLTSFPRNCYQPERKQQGQTTGQHLPWPHTLYRNPSRKWTHKVCELLGRCSDWVEGIDSYTHTCFGDWTAWTRDSRKTLMTFNSLL